MDTKAIVNTLYDGAIISGLTVAYAMIGSKFVGVDVGDPGRPTLNKVLKLTGAIAAAVATKDMLEQKNIIPVDPTI